ncbi:NAD(P)H-dependent oxidoreductase [Nocardia sp. CWNU-33]|uniref:NAD(P)H-dependent oxidoreductase n=1 Tax=Nocardia sp. CWNU-33 TaxID=3392117 RepID=UPI00398F4CE9
MNLYSLLEARTAKSGPIRIGVIGAGKFASMFLTQAPQVPGLHVVGVADLDVERARTALHRCGWPAERYAARSFDEALRSGGTHLTDDAEALIAVPGLEVIVEVTGNPIAGSYHAEKAIDAGRHVVMVNVEADCMVGPVLAEKARRNGVVYSMAYGDQPALINELVDWCRTVGFDIVAAGKGTKYLPEYNQSTPDTVWNFYGFTEEQLATGDFNPKMFNSFLDGTKSAIEMAAVANATGLRPQDEGLLFPPVDVDDLATTLRPKALGGTLTRSGTVEVISSLNRDGGPLNRDLRWGVYVTFEARTDYAVQCFAEYGMRTDPTGRFGSLYRPYHMIGLELGVSVASAVLRNEATGVAKDFHGDVTTVTKRALKAGEILDGEGGYMAFGKLAPAATALAARALPMGLAHGVKVVRDVPAGATLTYDDVAVDESLVAVRLRRELESATAAEQTAMSSAR